MTDKKEQSDARTTPTQGGKVLGRTILHDGIGVGVPNFAGWVLDWGAGLLRSGAYLLTGRIERPDYFANGPADRSAGGTWGAQGSMAVGQPLSDASGVGHIRTQSGAKAETGALNVNVSFDSGKSWDKASLGEGAAHWGGQIVDPTLALPVIGALNKARTIGKVATTADKAIGVAALGTMGVVIGHDVVLRGMILNPNEALDTLRTLNSPKKLNTTDGANDFNRKVNFMLKEFHDPINDRNNTSLFGKVKNKNYDPSKLYIPSLDPDMGQLQTTGTDSKNRTYKDNYLSASVEIDKVVEGARNKIADGKAEIRDYEIIQESQRFDSRFNTIAQRYLQQGNNMALDPTDNMTLHFKMMRSTYASLSPDKGETLKNLDQYLQEKYKDWSATPEGQASIRQGVQIGAISNLDKNAATVPNTHLNFMLQVQQNTLGQEMKATNQAAIPLMLAKAAEIEATATATFGVAPIIPGR